MTPDPTLIEQTNSGARRQADQALVQAPSPAVSALSGFDPSRVAILIREVGTHAGMAVAYISGMEHFEEALEAYSPYGRDCEYSAIPRDAVLEGKDWFQRTIDSASQMPWIRREHLLAIATEARRAETVKQGSVHEGAAPKEDAHD